jgi:hypothetical protein
MGPSHLPILGFLFGETIINLLNWPLVRPFKGSSGRSSSGDACGSRRLVRVSKFPQVETAQLEKNDHVLNGGSNGLGIYSYWYQL